ncbi:hypothetical protein [Streptomyces sp. NPDC016626]|uniref:hypothetical protein n=1 Tax=Streptomyces sp. NPDC016626 TaxID=3364968 RepID=UPI0036FA4DA2
MTEQALDVTTGPFGTARRVPSTNYHDSKPAGVDAWIITAPHAHPLWSQYMLAVVSLAGIPGLPDPVRHYPDATHELHVVALNPDHGPYDAARIGPPGTIHFLTPVNVAEQVTTTDDQARALAARCAQAVVDGLLNPETADAPDRIRAAWHTYIHHTE